MSELSERQKLVWLGLKQSTRQSSDGESLIIDLQNAFGDEYTDFKSSYEDANPQNFDEFEQFLVDNGIGAERASSIRTDFENRYADFGEFDTVVRDTESYVEFEEEFGTSNELSSGVENEDGTPAAGFKVYESGGVGRDGQYIPQGGVEVWGREVHFSQSGASEDNEDPGDTDGDTTYEFSYSELDISNTTPIPYEDITISAKVTNDSTRYRAESVQLLVDGEVYASKYVSVPPGDFKTVEFMWSSAEYVTVDMGIGPLSPETVSVSHPGLIQ